MFFYSCSIDRDDPSDLKTKGRIKLKKIEESVVNNFAGTYCFGENVELEPIGKLLVYPENDSSVLVLIETSKPAPSYNVRNLFTRLIIRENVAVFSRAIGKNTEGCGLKFIFENDKVTLEKVGAECGGFGGVSFVNTYTRKNVTKPEYFYDGAGTKVQFSDENGWFETNDEILLNQFEWSEPDGEHIGYFNPYKHTFEEIEGTYKLFNVCYPVGSWLNTTLSDGESLNEMLADISQSYNEHMSKIERLEFVQDSFSLNFKKNLMIQFKQELEINELMCKAFFQPEQFRKSAHFHKFTKEAEFLIRNDLAIMDTRKKDVAYKSQLDLEIVKKEYRNKIRKILIEQTIFNKTPQLRIEAQNKFLTYFQVVDSDWIDFSEGY